MLHGNEACQRCAYWERLKSAAADPGLCRRQSPLLEFATWPTTDQDDWCGEFVETPPNNSTRLKEALNEGPSLAERHAAYTRILNRPET